MGEVHLQGHTLGACPDPCTEAPSQPHPCPRQYIPTPDEGRVQLYPAPRQAFRYGLKPVSSLGKDRESWVESSPNASGVEGKAEASNYQHETAKYCPKGHLSVSERTGPALAGPFSISDQLPLRDHN